MGKQNKRNKETAVSDVEKKDEQLLDSAEQAGDVTGPADHDVGQDPGTEGPADTAPSNEGGDTPAEASDVPPVVTLADLAPAPEKPVFVEPRSDKADAIINYIREYVAKMDPSKYHDAKSGVPAQARLYRLVVELMKLDFTEFKYGMDQLLKLIFEYRAAAFSDIYSRRFFENLYPTLTHAQVLEFDNLLSILVTVGASSNRSRAMKQIDLQAALKSVKDAKSQQNMSAYFGALR